MNIQIIPEYNTSVVSDADTAANKDDVGFIVEPDDSLRSDLSSDKNDLDMSDKTDLTSILQSESDSSSCDDGNSETSSSSAASTATTPSSPQEDEEPPRQSHKKSVRFSIVHTREYILDSDLVSPEDNDDPESENEPPRKSLGWEYTDKEEVDLDTHLKELQKERKDRYLTMIQDHINRVENEKAEKERARQEKLQKKKKRGFKSKVLKPLWKGFLEAGSRSALVIPTYA